MKKIQPYEKAVLSAKNQFIKISGKESWLRESDFALAHSLELHNCEPESITRAVLNIAYTGTTISQVYRESFLVARDGKCFLDFSYRGLIKIATSEGAVTSMSAGVIYSWDTMDCRQGTGAYLHIVPSMNPPKDPDEIARNPKLIWEFVKCAYSVATFPNGQQDFIIAPKWKLLKTWNSTGASANGINQAWPEEWIRKTAVIYHSKTLPRAQKLVAAVSVLNEHEGVSVRKKKSKSRLV